MLRAARSPGQGIVEYGLILFLTLAITALILALIAIIAIVALIFLGQQVSQQLSNVGKSI